MTVSWTTIVAFVGMLAAGPGCPPDPFTPERMATLDSQYPGQAFTAYAWDEVTGCTYSMNPDNRQPTASVFKVMVMAGTLLEAQEDGRQLTANERNQITPMISVSANNPVRSLWSRFGGAPWYSRQADIFGLDETSTVGDYGSGWGRTRTSARDQVALLRQVLFGQFGPLDVNSRAEAWGFMTAIDPNQRWGLSTAAPPGSIVAQKNGFAGVTANSVGGVVRSDGSSYAMAVLTTGWSNWTRGVEAVDLIASWIHETLRSTPPVAPRPPDRYWGIELRGSHPTRSAGQVATLD
ncbi:MAG TPA: serine hydrolase [Acidimicrobiia bacterium]|nr:serine hydrolase [Acidimicrobiia bacterium]